MRVKESVLNLLNFCICLGLIINASKLLLIELGPNDNKIIL